MKTILLIAALVMAAAPLRAQHFSASDVPGIGIHRTGRIVIEIVGTPRALRAPSAFSELIDKAASTHGVDARLVAAVAARESAWNPLAVSARGACGLMQLMPATARTLGVTDIFDPAQNVDAGARYLKSLLDTFGGDLDRALAAYNAGRARCSATAECRRSRRRASTSTGFALRTKAGVERRKAEGRRQKSEVSR